MKKTLIITIICILFTLSACTNGNSPTSITQTSTPTSAPTATPTLAPPPTPTPAPKREITASSVTAIEQGWSKVDEYKVDFNGDGNDDTITLYTSASKNKKGDIEWDDSQMWLLEANDGTNYFPLYKQKVQLGYLYFEYADYYKENKTTPTISLIKSSSAAFSLINYSYDITKNCFNESVKYDSSDFSDEGINQRYSSIPNIG